ncbi:MAG: DUF2520 domain-containing protein [Actinomycetes bacterium]
MSTGQDAAVGVLRVRVVGPGRAGTSLATALAAVGWEVELLGRHDAVTSAADDVDLLLLCVPDTVVAQVAAQVRPVPATVVAHVAGALGLDVLAPHARCAALHPLVSMPTAEVGAQRLDGAWFATAGDPLVQQVVTALGGRSVDVADSDRVAYHAAAAIASNHLVALLGQVERVAAQVGVPLDAYLDLVRGGVESVAALGPAAALTGPVARGDVDMVRRHLAALPESERDAYRALAHEVAQLVGRTREFAFLLGPAPGRAGPT